MTSRMQVPNEFAAEMLRAGAAGYAALAAREMVGDRGELVDVHGPRPFIDWRDNLVARIEYLATALETGSPSLFAHQVAWAKAAFIARDVPLDLLRTSLVCLLRVVQAELPESHRDQVAEFIRLAIVELDRAPQDLPSSLAVGTPHGRVAATYLLALLEGDRRRAAETVLDLAKSGVSVREIYLSVLTPVQEELGRMWHMNEISVAEEHFATATTQLVMSMLYPHLDRKPFNGQTVVCAAVQENTHEIGIRMVADFFEIDGWRPIYLGPNMPADDLPSAVADFGAGVLALSAGLTTQIRRVREAIESVRADPSSAGVKILVGGAAFAGAGELYRRLGADGWASSGEEAVAEGRRLAGLPPSDV